MKKLFTILMLIVTVVSLNAQLSIYYCTKDKAASMDPSAGADPVLAMLQADERFTVTVNQDAGTAIGDVSAYDLVILSEAPGSADALTASMKGIDARFLNMKVYAYKSGVWDWGTASDGPGADIKIADGMETHPIFKDLTITDGKVTLFKRTSDDYGAAGSKATNYASGLAAITGDILTLAYPDGALEADAVNVQATEDPAATFGGTPIPKKYVLLGLNFGAMCADNSTNLTDDGILLIQNAINWLVSDLLPSNVDNKFNNKLNAYGISGNIRIITDEPVDVAIYSIDGRLVKQTTIYNTTNIPCKSGLYVVNVANAGVAKVYVGK